MAKHNFYVDVDLNGSQLLCGSIISTAIASAAVRQTVQCGSVDGSGFPNALSIGSGLAVTLTAAGTPFELSFAAGFNNGAIDYPGRLTANQSFSALAASTTCFLYIDRSSSGALTTGFSVLAPVYATSAPSSPATDQHWFDLSSFTMKRWSGSAWVVYLRIFVGECVAGASTITSVITYAYRRFYRSSWTAVVATTPYNFNHNLGIPLASASVAVKVWASVTGSDSDAVLATPQFPLGSNYYGYFIANNGLAVRRTIQVYTQNFVLLNNSNTWVTSGYYAVEICGVG